MDRKGSVLNSLMNLEQLFTNLGDLRFRGRKMNE